jgi:hypothetical protein
VRSVKNALLGAIAWSGHPIRDKLRKSKICQEHREMVPN